MLVQRHDTGSLVERQARSRGGEPWATAVVLRLPSNLAAQARARQAPPHDLCNARCFSPLFSNRPSNVCVSIPSRTHGGSEPLGCSSRTTSPSSPTPHQGHLSPCPLTPFASGDEAGRGVPTPGPARGWHQREIDDALGQRKVLTPNACASVADVEQRLRLYAALSNPQPRPLAWQVTRAQLAEFLKRLAAHGVMTDQGQAVQALPDTDQDEPLTA